MPADFPFGFSPGDPDEPGRPGEPPGWPAGLPPIADLARLMSWRGGPVNWDVARQVALQALGDDDPAISADGQAEVGDALHLADLWLEDVTALPSGLTGPAQAWTRAGFVQTTLPVWQALIDPVAERLAAAVQTSMQAGLAGLAEHGLPPEFAALLPPQLAQALPADPAALRALLEPMQGMLGQVSGLLFGSQVGQGLGALAGDLLCSTEVGLPLASAGIGALLPANLAAFGGGLDVPAAEVRLFLALREAAAARLFGHVQWLRSAVLGAVAEYARGITIDPEQLQRRMGALSGVDLSDPQALGQAVGAGLFDVPDSPAQARALARLETLLALLEGWVDCVSYAAASGRLPHTEALRETLRRRRATGGPAEATFAALVGLTLRPRRLREAAALWEQLAASRGIPGRDALWAHPDLLPDGDDLDQPAAFLQPDAGVASNPVAEIEALYAAQARPPAEPELPTAHPDSPADPPAPEPPPTEPGPDPEPG